MFEFISNHYWDIFTISVVCYTIMFTCINNSLNRGQSGTSVLTLLAVIDTLCDHPKHNRFVDCTT